MLHGLVQGAAEGHVHHLHAAADAEDGQARRPGHAGQGKLVPVHVRVGVAQPRDGLFPVGQGIQVHPAGEHHAVQEGKLGLQILSLEDHGQHHRHGSREGQRVEVVLVHIGPFRSREGFVVIHEYVGRYPDDGFSIAHGTPFDLSPSWIPTEQ